MYHGAVLSIFVGEGALVSVVNESLGFIVYNELSHFWAHIVLLIFHGGNVVAKKEFVQITDPP